MTTPAYSMLPDTPLLRLTCQNCGKAMIRHTAYGLRVRTRDKVAEVVERQDCGECGHSHAPGILLTVEARA